MKLLEQMEGFVSDSLGMIKTVVSIIKLETRLTVLSVYPLLLTVCMLLIVVTTIWFSTMLLLGYFFTLFFESAMMAIGSVLLLNGVLFVVLITYLKFNLRQMSFEKTRACFSKKEEHEDDELKKTSAG